jgi:type IX secretion system substrate protein
MKKTLLFIATLTVLLSVKLNAQITITQADFPTAGTLWLELEDDRLGVHNITGAGPSQSWNYANAFVISDTTVLNFLLPTATPPNWASNFPNANLAFLDPAGTQATYLRSANDGFYIDGAYDTSGVALQLDPDGLVVPAPFTYNDNRTNISTFTIDQPAVPPNPGLRFKLYTISDFTADAYGSLVTPGGTFANTLRIKNFEYTIDSIFIDLTGTGTYTFLSSSGPQDSTIYYYFYKNGLNSFLMTIEQDASTMQTTGASYFQVGVVGINENLTNSDINVYPNPVGDGVVNFEFSTPAFNNIKVYDVSGRLVYENNITGINQLRIHTSNYKPGVYVYELQGDDSPPVRDKFIVQ